jgi:hypothetical protein
LTILAKKISLRRIFRSRKSEIKNVPYGSLG